MAGKIAIDFGTSNTRVAVWDEVQQTGKPLFIPGISAVTTIQTDGNSVEFFNIPSLIHYNAASVTIGKQVADGGHESSPTTFKWIKRYISNRMELPRNVGNRRIGYSEAGKDFLNQLFNYISTSIDFRDQEVVFTVPVDTYEHYQDWLTQVCEAAGITRWRLLDEPSAAALGYGVNIQANDVYLIFDFGAGTLDVSVVKIEANPSGGKRCRVLGKSGADLGGSALDNWLYKDVIEKNRLAQEDLLHLSMQLLNEVEKAKIKLSFEEKTAIAITDFNTGDVISHSWSRTAFEDLLDEKGFYSTIQNTIDHALQEAAEKGILKEHIKAVLLTGGSSLIPSVKKTLTRQFGNRVHYHRPLDSAALGGAAFAGGVDFYDHIHHDYALKHYDQKKGDYEYEILVHAGTSYPSPEDKPLKELTLKAAFDNQVSLGIDIYEINRKHIDNENAPLDLVFDPNGGARFRPKQDPKILSSFWMNEHTPTFVHADPPAKKEDPRFATRFFIDGNKRLCMTVFDNQTRKPLLVNHPIIRLT
jgi:molecular chaperone DnaK (HSP70)